VADRTVPRIAVGLWFVLKAPNQARDLKRRASRKAPGPERDALLASAKYFSWASEHPVEATQQVENLWDRLRHPEGHTDPFSEWIVNPTPPTWS